MIKYLLKYLFILVYLQLTTVCIAQESSHLGIGAGGGYKGINPDAGFIVEYNVRNVFSMYFGTTVAQYGRFSYTIGTDFFVTKKPWQPMIGVAFNHLSSNEFLEGEYKVNQAAYKIESSDNFIGILGVRKVILPDDKDRKGFLSFTPYLGYTYANPIRSVQYLSGTIDKNREDKINSNISGGFGGGIKLIFFFGYRKTEALD
jgi:hypothetical protein